MKRSTSLLLSLFLCVFVLAGCQKKTPVNTTPASPSTNGKETTNTKDFMKGTLRVIGPGFTSENDTEDPQTKLVRMGYKKLIEMFEKDYPNMKLEIEAIPWDSWQAKLQAAATGGQADVLVHGGSVVNVVEDLGPYLKKDPDLLSQLYVKGTFRRPDEDNYDQLKLTAIPVGMNAYLYVYDKQLFDDFGVPYPTSETTWEGMLDKMEKLTGKNPRTGEQCYGATINMSATNSWRPFLSYNMAKDITSVEIAKQKFDTKLKFDTPEVISTFSFMQRLSKFFPPGFLENKGFEGFGTAKNNIAIYLDVMPYNNYKATLANKTVDRYGYAPYPKNEKNPGYAFFLGDWNMAIPKTSGNKEAAWEFIKWMATDEDVVDYIMATGNLPNSQKGFSKLLESGMPFVEPLKIEFANFPDKFWAPSSKYYDNMLGPIESIFVNHVTSLYSNKITPEDCAKKIQKEMTEYLDGNK